MIHYKTPEEIKIMAKGGKILSEVLEEVLKHAKPGVTEIELDNLAEDLILQKGGKPGFQLVEGYEHATCVSTNDVVVHGIPTAYRLKEGDVIGIDCGVYLDGFHTDMSETVRVTSEKRKMQNEKQDEIDLFLATGKKALLEAIKEVKAGRRVGNISQTIQALVEGNGYSVVRSLIGHGVGRELHEDPEIPGYLHGSIMKTPELKVGMVIAVEVIYNMGKHDVVYANRDGWTIKTKDGSVSGVFERTIAVGKNGPIFLTPDI